MKAVRLHGVGDLRVEDVPPPAALVAGEVRLKVLAAGICGSDLHNFRTGHWISRVPSIPGHEVAAEVVEIGADVGTLVIGDRVVADLRVACGRCVMCGEGRANLCLHLGYLGEVCDGGFAEELVLPATAANAGHDRPRPRRRGNGRAAGGGAPRRLALGGEGRHAGAGGGLRADRRPRGAGPCTSRRLAGSRRRPQSRTTATRRRGYRCHSGSARAGGGYGGVAGAPLRHAVEATGSTAAAAALLDLVDNGATIALVGIFHDRLDLDPNRLVEREVSLVGCSAFSGELKDAVDRLPELAADLARFVDAPIGLDAVPAAFQRLIDGRADKLKTVVVPGS